MILTSLAEFFIFKPLVLLLEALTGGELLLMVMSPGQETSQPSLFSFDIRCSCCREWKFAHLHQMWLSEKTQQKQEYDAQKVWGGGKELVRCTIKSTPISMGRWIRHILNGAHHAHYFRRAIGQTRDLTLLLHQTWQKENLNQFLCFISAPPYRITVSSSVISYYVLLLKWAVSQFSEALGSSSNTNLTGELASLRPALAECSALQLTFRKQLLLEACLTPGLWLRI